MKTLTGDRATPRRVSVVSGASVSRQKDGLGAGRELPEDTYDKTLDLRAMGRTQLGCIGVPIPMAMRSNRRISEDFTCRSIVFCVQR